MNPFAIPMAFTLAGQLLTDRAERETEVKNGLPAKEGFAALPRFRTAGITESVVCPGIDLDAYKKNCRAKVFRDHWNYWKLLRSTADGLPISDVKTAAKALMQMVSQDATGSIRNVEVVSGPLANPWGTPLLESRNSVCVTPMTLRASEFSPAYYEVFVRFIYRGVENDLVWPARKIGAAGAAENTLGVHCPVGTDWLLDAVYTPSAIDVPPESEDPLPPLYQDLPGDMGLDPSKWELGTQLLVGGGVLLGVAVLAGYAVRSFR